MKSIQKRMIIPALACSLFVFSTGCGNSNSNNSGNNDTSAMSSALDSAGSKVKQAAGNVEQDANKATESVEESVSGNPDSLFVEQVMISNNEEIKLLQAGIDKGTSKLLVKDAKKMITDHKGLEKKVEEYATKNNFPIADDMGKAAEVLNGMSDKSGNDWDKAWTETLYKGHEKAIGDFEGAENRVKDATLKTMIENTLPTLKMHLGMVEKLQTDLKK